MNNLQKLTALPKIKKEDNNIFLTDLDRTLTYKTNRKDNQENELGNNTIKELKDENFNLNQLNIEIKDKNKLLKKQNNELLNRLQEFQSNIIIQTHLHTF